MNTPIPHTANPLTVAQESMKMGKESGDRNFKLIALAVMAATGIATLLHAAHVVWRDLREERRQGRRYDRPQFRPDISGNAGDERAESQPLRHDEQSWVRKARLTERPEGEQRWAEQRGGHSHARRQ
jgi:hypothetical protein